MVGAAHRRAQKRAHVTSSNFFARTFFRWCRQRCRSNIGRSGVSRAISARKLGWGTVGEHFSTKGEDQNGRSHHEKRGMVGTAASRASNRKRPDEIGAS